MDKFSYLGNIEINEIEDLYQRYLTNPDSVEQSWKEFFRGFDFAKSRTSSISKADGLGVRQEFSVINLINGYRNRGHLFTKTNPVRERRKYFPTLDLENFGLSKSDLETVFHAGSLIGIGDATLKDIIEHLEATYCQSIGAEYKYIRTP